MGSVWAVAVGVVVRFRFETATEFSSGVAVTVGERAGVVGTGSVESVTGVDVSEEGRMVGEGLTTINPAVGICAFGVGVVSAI